MTMNLAYEHLWSAKLTALGTRLNNVEEMTMADKLLAPMEHFALHRHNFSPCKQDLADVYVPIDKEELQAYIPCAENGWMLPRIDFRTNMDYKLDLDIFRKEYIWQYDICNKFPETNPMATWETILKYWRQAARFFLGYWTMHHELEKIDAVDAAIRIIRNEFTQHQDLEKYCENKLLPAFKHKMMAIVIRSRKRQASSISSGDSSCGESESGGDESSKVAEALDRESESGGKSLEGAESSNESSEVAEALECSEPSPPSSGLSQEIANHSESADDSSYHLSDNSVSLASAENELKNGHIYDLDDTEAIDNKDFEGERELERQWQETGQVVKTLPLPAFLSVVAESEPNQDESEGEDSDAGSFCLQGEREIQQCSYSSYATDQDYRLDMNSSCEECTVTTESSEQEANLEEPTLGFKLEMSDVYSNIRHFVDHLVLHGLMPAGMTEPTWSSVKNTMKAFGMHIEEQAGVSNEDYVNAYSTWVPVLHLDNFPKYMSSFHEICCSDVMRAHRLGRQSKAQKVCEIPREEVDERIADYLQRYAPPSVKEQDWEGIMQMLRGQLVQN